MRNRKYISADEQENGSWKLFVIDGQESPKKFNIANEEELLKFIEGYLASW